MGILKVFESNTKLCWELDWAFALSFTVREKEKDSNEGERKVGL